MIYLLLFFLEQIEINYCFDSFFNYFYLLFLYLDFFFFNSNESNSHIYIHTVTMPLLKVKF